MNPKRVFSRHTLSIEVWASPKYYFCAAIFRLEALLYDILLLQNGSDNIFDIFLPMKNSI